MRSRRCFLQAGATAIGGLSLAQLGKLQAEVGTRSSISDTNVILFWLSGGPGHMETWDPKPLAPSEYRGPLQAIDTSVGGIQFGELLPEQAKIADKLSVVRTVNHGSGDHTKGNHWMLTGYEGPAFNAADNRQQKRPSIGSAVARLRSAKVQGMPPYVGLPHLRGGTDNLFHYGSYLGRAFDPFIVNSDPNDAAYGVKNLTISDKLTLNRITDRRSLSASLDRLQSTSESPMSDLSKYQQAAFDLLTSQGAKDAFDISRETDSLRDRYGRHTFGQSALVARRLVESGVTFVTVNCVPWDHHGSPGQYKTEEGARLLIPPLDRAIAALVEDLIDRGLYEKTLIVAMGEFGRTPRMNANAGRDHWGNTFSVLFGGGGMNMGQAIGRSSARGEHVVDQPVDPQDIAATIYHHLGIDASSVTFYDHLDRPLTLLDRGKPIHDLVG